MLTLSNSAIQMYNECPQKYKLRYLDCLESLEVHKYLELGTNWHKLMEFLWKNPNANKNMLVQQVYQLELGQEDSAKMLAMLISYQNQHKDFMNMFKVIDTEMQFNNRIDYPLEFNGTCDIRLVGTVDGLLELDGKHYLLEHKTTSRLNEDYLSNLEDDFQINFYAKELERFLRVRIDGVVYSVIQKPSVKFQEEESEEEFKQRYDEACKGNKSGKSSIKRNVGDTYESYLEKVLGYYKNRPDRIAVEIVTLTEESYKNCSHKTARVIEQIESYHSFRFMKDTSKCINKQTGSKCTYYSLCKSSNKEFALEHYQMVDPWRELEK